MRTYEHAWRTHAHKIYFFALRVAKPKTYCSRQTMDAHEDKVSTAAATETTLKQEDPGQRNNNPTEGNSASVGVEVSTDPRLGEDADDTEERRVSKLECFTCGILRRRRARGRKTPRLEFVEDPPQQQQEALGAPSAENSGGPREPDSSGAGAAELAISPELKESATEGETSAVKQEITDGANPRYS